MEEDIKMATIGYCVKCKKKRDMVGAVETVLKNAKRAMKGKCSVCGTGMMKFLPAK
jgi:hypothetical protein